jgi:hypothetical protein
LLNLNLNLSIFLLNLDLTCQFFSEPGPELVNFLLNLNLKLV